MLDPENCLVWWGQKLEKQWDDEKVGEESCIPCHLA